VLCKNPVEPGTPENRRIDVVGEGLLPMERSINWPRRAPPDSRPRSALHGHLPEGAAGQWR